MVAPAQSARPGRERLQAYLAGDLASIQDRTFAGRCFWAAAAAEFDDRPGAVRDPAIDGLRAWLGELERQARIGGLSEPQELAFEVYSLGLGASTYARLCEI